MFFLASLYLARSPLPPGGQAQHIRKRGFDNRYYRDLLLELIREHGPIGPAVITELFLDKLPDSMTSAQKRIKTRNLTFELAHRRKLIENVGTPRGAGALWKPPRRINTALIRGESEKLKFRLPQFKVLYVLIGDEES